MTCSKCGGLLDPNARFCGACGHAFLATASDPQLAAAPPDPMSAMIGREVAGRFRIVAKLGEGGMGAVFRAEQISLKRTVALKLLRPSVATSGQLIRRFNAEAQAIAQLSHPNTVGIFDFGEHEGMLFIAMELIEGRSLRDAVHAEAPMPPARAAHIAMQIAASLSDAHAHGIVHRDLKPDNVMLQTRGRERDVVRVLDFGIAKLRDEGRAGNLTAAGDILGTPQYIAPEQASGGLIDARTDVYALGCLLYELVTGRLPFEGNSVVELLTKHVAAPVVPPSQRRPDLHVPPALDALIVAAMAKDPARRPPTMDAFGEVLAQLLPTLPALPAGPSGERTAAQAIATPSWTPPPVSPTVPGAPAARSRTPLIAGIVLLLAGIGAIAFALTRRGHETKPAAIAEPEKPAADAPVVAVVPVVAVDAPAFDPTTQSNTLPPGAMLINPGGGYVQTRTDEVDSLKKQGAGIEMRVANDPGDLQTLAAAVAKSQGLTVARSGTITSAGAPREAVWLRGVVQGVEIAMIIVLYEGPAYRLGVIAAMPAAQYDEAAMQQFFAEDVAMP